MMQTSPPIDPRPATKGQITGWHVLFAMLAFFGTVIGVNIVFIVTAIGTNTGVVAVEPYRKGLHYNERIAFEARQAELGWRHTLEFGADASAINLILTAKDGAPISGASISGFVGRPSTNSEDRTLAFSEVAPGRYTAAIKQLQPGGYIASIEIARSAAEDQSPVYRAKERLWVKP